MRGEDQGTIDAIIKHLESLGYSVASERDGLALSATKGDERHEVTGTNQYRAAVALALAAGIDFD